jgi:hypothetical protein
MPNLFFSGKLNFQVSGSAADAKDLKKAVESNEFGIVFSYEIEEIPYTFYLHPWHMTSGQFVVAQKGREFAVSFDGTAKVPVDKPTADYLTKKGSVLNISGVLGDRQRLSIDGEGGRAIASPLKLSKSAPK